jgi:hypothetical protein
VIFLTFPICSSGSTTAVPGGAVPDGEGDVEVSPGAEPGGNGRAERAPHDHGQHPVAPRAITFYGLVSVGIAGEGPETAGRERLDRTLPPPPRERVARREAGQEDHVRGELGLAVHAIGAHGRVEVPDVAQSSPRALGRERAAGTNRSSSLLTTARRGEVLIHQKA